ASDAYSANAESYRVTVVRGAPLDLDRVAAEGRAISLGFPFTDWTVEWTTVYGQRAVVLLTTPGEALGHPGYALWWNTAGAAIGITGVNADVDVVRGIAAGIETGPPPVGPADQAAATMAVTETVQRAFAGATRHDERLAAVENGAPLMPAFEQFDEEHPESSGTAVVDQVGVRFTAPDAGVVTFRVTLVMPGSEPGQTTSAFQNAVVTFVGGRWLVERDSYCTVVRQILDCPPE
nr:hypothetical protein [Micromonospora sp. DSM 115978]